MPVSTTGHISHCLQYILRINPTSVLDVGCGFGLWGFLCRMHLDVANERVSPENWRIRIDGIEYFEPYIQAHQRALYSSIRIGDIRNLADSLDSYDLIIAGDVIEHLEHEDAEIVLDRLYAKARKAFLVCIPLGQGWEHPACHGNPQELHRSVWRIEDFDPYPYEGQVFTLPCGEYGVFCCNKGMVPEARRMGLLTAAQRREAEGRLPLAAMYASRLQELDPRNASSAFLFSDLLFREGKTEQAIGVLRALTLANPECVDGALMLRRALDAFGKRADASALSFPSGTA